jgi:hypothetical protein
LLSSRPPSSWPGLSWPADLSDFYTTLTDGNMPSVSFLKAAEY